MPENLPPSPASDASAQSPAWPLTIEEAFKATDEELQIPPERSFSKRGYAELNAAVQAYIADLIATSARLARRQGVDSISAAHVLHAVRSITPRPEHKISRTLGVAGSLLLGAFLPEFFKAFMTPGQQLSMFWAIIGILGAVMMVYEQVRN